MSGIRWDCDATSRAQVRKTANITIREAKLLEYEICVRVVYM